MTGKRSSAKGGGKQPRATGVIRLDCDSSNIEGGSAGQPENIRENVVMCVLPETFEGPNVKAMLEEAKNAMQVEVTDTLQQFRESVLASVASLQAGIDELQAASMAMQAQLGTLGDRITAVEAAVRDGQRAMQEHAEEIRQVVLDAGPPPHPRNAADGNAEEELPYVSVEIDGVPYDLKLSEQDRLSIIGAKKVREVVRIVLRHFYTIPELREVGLSGKCQRGEPKTRIPPHILELALAASLRVIPLPIVVQQGNSYGQNPGDILKSARMKEIREHISSLLQYFREAYGTSGCRLTPQSDGTPRRRQNLKRRTLDPTTNEETEEGDQ